MKLDINSKSGIMESELPKHPLIRYTDSRILIGNWNEENFAKEEKFRKFLAKRERGDLISQKSSQIFVNFLKDIQLEVRCDFIRFGAIIQIMSPDMPKINTNDQSLVVSIAIDGLSVDRIQKINSDCIVSLAPSDRPTVRNTFVITSPDDTVRTNEILKYNQDFTLKCVDADEMLCSAPKLCTLNSSTYCPYKYLKNGEINQNVGLAVRKNDETTAVRPMHFRWRCLHKDPSIRFETEGKHVPSNCKLVICHSATNKLLAGEDVLFKGVFGMCENCKNDLKLHTAACPLIINRNQKCHCMRNTLIEKRKKKKFLNQRNPSLLHIHRFIVFGQTILEEYGLSVTTYKTVQKIETYKNVWLLKTQ